MGIVFEWDSNKARTNFVKHHVAFEEATTIFGDKNSITIKNADVVIGERRFITIGKSSNDRIIVVIHTDRGEKIRIISARSASRKERKQYTHET